MCNFQAQNGPFVLNSFFGTNHYYYFHLPVGPFHCAKFTKSCEDATYWAQNGPFAPPPPPPTPEKCSFWKIIKTIFI